MHVCRTGLLAGRQRRIYGCRWTEWNYRCTSSGISFKQRWHSSKNRANYWINHCSVSLRWARARVIVGRSALLSLQCKSIIAVPCTRDVVDHADKRHRPLPCRVDDLRANNGYKPSHIQPDLDRRKEQITCTQSDAKKCGPWVKTCHIDKVKWRHTSMVAIRWPFCRSRPSYCA